MGVKDTFRLCNLEPISKEIYMMLWNSDRRTIGVDGYVLLHKYLSNYGEIITRNPQRYIPLVYQNIYNHLHEMAHCIEPIGVFTMIVIFDGNKMNYKISEKTRATKREHAKEVNDFSQSFDVQPIQAYYLCKYLENKNIKCYVAPFEADAQLAYMYKTNLIQVVYTCDTDLIYYGVNHILFSITRKDFKGIMYYESQNSNLSSSINNMDENKRLLFAITLGNDYCKGVPLYGYKKTWPKLVPFTVTLKENECVVDWEKTIKDYLTLLINSVKSKTVKYNIELLTEDALRCVRVYLHQPVFDVLTGTLVDMQGKLVLTPDGYCDFGALNGPIDDILYCRIDPETGIKFPNLVI